MDGPLDGPVGQDKRHADVFGGGEGWVVDIFSQCISSGDRRSMAGRDPLFRKNVVHYRSLSKVRRER